MPKKGMTRASNGMGSIRQRSDGRWEARYTTPSGTQKSIYGKTEKEVSAKLRAALHDIDSGSWREPSRMTVEGWSKTWLADYQTHTTPSTVHTYESVIRSRVIPIIGSIRMDVLSTIHVRKVISKMTDDGLSARYTEHCLNVMSAMFTAAIEAGVLRQNPTANVKTPRVVKAKMTIIDRDLFPAFIAACKKHRHGLAIIFLLLTGLRAGEERGLCWHDVDFDVSTMEVARQIPLNGNREFSPPKDGSVRTIEMPKEAMELLKQQKKELAAMRLSAGSQWQDDELTRDLVFRSPYGGVLGRTLIRNAVKSIGKEIGLPDLHPHDLRHSYAVAALRSGIDVKTVQNNLGHKSAAITLDTYAGYTQDAGKAGAVKFSAYWQEAIKTVK